MRVCGGKSVRDEGMRDEGMWDVGVRDEGVWLCEGYLVSNSQVRPWNV